MMLCFTGVAVGSGWQSVVAWVNVATYYIIGLPIGIVLGYLLNLGVEVSSKSYNFLLHKNLA